VDGDLNVYSTVGLKAVHLSMVPENKGTNMYNTALVVGEKAAVIIGRELGIEVLEVGFDDVRGFESGGI